VVNRAGGLYRRGIVQGGCHGAFSGAGFATIVVAVQENIFGAGVPEDIDAGIARYLLRAVAPEDDFLVQIEHAHADLQAIEDVAVNLGILKSRHWVRKSAEAIVSIGGEAFGLKELGLARPGTSVRRAGAFAVSPASSTLGVRW